MSSESISEQVKPAPHINAPMSKTRIMQYTFAALLVITVVTAILWFPVTCPTDAQLQIYTTLTGSWQMPLGAILLINALVALGVAIGIDLLFSKLVSDSQLNIWSSAVFALIVTLCFSLGVPSMAMGTGDVMPIATFTAPNAFVFVALITMVGQVVFKKVLGAGGARKPLNPAAAAKFLILLPFLFTMLLPKEHYASMETGGIGMPLLAGPLGGGDLPVGSNGLGSFTSYLQSCYANPSSTAVADLNSLMILEKFHGWPGGASSILVIIVGIALFALAHKYFKWKVTGAYFASIVVMSLIMSTVYADTDLVSRLLFEVFIGSSIFLGFFMATDPATTPFSGTGQIIFGVGLGVLTVLIQTYMNFLGGSLLALIIMNLTVPLIDRIRIGKPFGR
ncbi:MAG: RnfABCDGE type electron transport complex subunit D [Candidatus Bathyarchaeota archaeon]|nr:RnfABCDGE type electron transport complex subunit D [Candidatus Bathyarchaeota archaeon]